ncbi:hypothetical protein E2C01_080997 [Portunus trituberculatus]|uniref:Uncharacterized protein n=1 Tax=Portunus trituberculatus TaxID=210409 RepID=A0A5B7IL29_PORTR|nr:hypothetical protein [Portunus trituberculatus]
MLRHCSCEASALWCCCLTKRILNCSSDSNDAASQPAAKAAKQGDAFVLDDEESTNSPVDFPFSVPHNPPLTSQSPPAFPTFAPSLR